MIVISQRVVYLYILNDCGGSVSTSGRTSYAYLIARGIGCDDDVWVQVILNELVELGLVRIRRNTAEIIEEVNPDTLDDGDPDEEDEDMANIATAEEGAPAIAPTALAKRSRPMAREAPPATVRWRTESGVQARQPNDDDKLRARIRQLTARNETLAQRVVAERTKRKEAQRLAVVAEGPAPLQPDRVGGVFIAYLVQLFYAAQQVANELAACQEELAGAHALMAHLERDLAEARASVQEPSEQLALELERVREECQRLEQANAKLTAQVVDLRRSVAGMEQISLVDGATIERLSGIIERLSPVVEEVTRARKRPTRLSCGHEAVTLVNSREHRPGIVQGCNCVEVVETSSGPQTPLLRARQPELPAAFQRKRK